MRQTGTVRISGGDARGIRLKAVPGSRPTTEVVRQAIFSSLQSALIDARVLDLFCGSGAFGLEALSRGASSAVLVDASAQAVATAKANARAVGVEERVRVRRRDALQYAGRDARRDGPFDLVFVDPPYADKDAPRSALERLDDAVPTGGRVVLELRIGRAVADAPPGWVLEADRKYGDTRILVYRRLRAESR